MVKTTISLSSYVLLSVEVLVPYPERLFLVLVFVPSEIVLDLIVSELTFFEGHYSLLYAGKLLVFAIWIMNLLICMIGLGVFEKGLDDFGESLWVLIHQSMSCSFYLY